MQLLRFNLDLFGPGASHAPQITSPQSTPVVTGNTIKATESSAGAVPQTVLFSHPRANREALLRGGVVAFEFRRAKRRSIGFLIGPDGLVVRAPSWVPLQEVDAAVQEKGSWIVKKLAETRQRHESLESNRMQWHDGASLTFLGQPVQLWIDPAHAFEGAGAALVNQALNPGDAPLLRLQLGLAHNASVPQIRDAAQAWLMRQSKRIFEERLNHFAARLGVRWTKLSLSNAGTRWGSARADGSIRLHWRLVHFRMPVIDYVVAHELSHLRVMDHSPRFWDTVRSVVPDYTEQVKHLKKNVLPPWG